MFLLYNLERWSYLLIWNLSKKHPSGVFKVIRSKFFSNFSSKIDDKTNVKTGNNCLIYKIIEIKLRISHFTWKKVRMGSKIDETRKATYLKMKM